MHPDLLLGISVLRKDSSIIFGKHARHPVLRRQGHLPEHGAWGRVLWAYVRWFWTRTWRVRSWMQRDPVLREYAHMVETAKSGNVS